MTELFNEALGAHQVPLTILLGFVLLYWLLVALGVMEGDFEVSDGSVGLEGGGEQTGDLSAMGAAWITVGRWLGFAKVPIVVWGSFFILFFWLVALLLNAIFNGAPEARSLFTAGILLVPSAFFSLILTKLVTWPLGKVFTLLGTTKSEAVEVIGQVGRVTSSLVDESFGQVEIAGTGAPVSIRVRLVRGAATLRRGDAAQVLELADDGIHYYVAPAPLSPPTV
jgi:hypothetical protein